MKKLILLAMAVMAAMSLSPCSAQEIFPEEMKNQEGVKLVRFSPWMLEKGMKGNMSMLQSYGIHKLTVFELVSSEDSIKCDLLSQNLDRLVKDMKLETAFEVRDDEQKFNMYVSPASDKEGWADAIVFGIQEPKEITILGLRGKFDLAMMMTRSVNTKIGSVYLPGIGNIQL